MIIKVAMFNTLDKEAGVKDAVKAAWAYTKRMGNKAAHGESHASAKLNDLLHIESKEELLKRVKGKDTKGVVNFLKSHSAGTAGAVAAGATAGGIAYARKKK